MNRDATIDRVEELTEGPFTGQLVAFPEAFVPGTPIWIDAGRMAIWDGDAVVRFLANAV